MSPILLVNADALGPFIFSSMIFVILFFGAVSLFEWLWNMTIPDIFKARPITFWESFRLLIIGALWTGALLSFGVCVRILL